MSKMPKIIQGKFRILDNRKVGRGYFRMAIAAPRIAKAARPGQFVLLRCSNGPEPLLRRPFSFHRLRKNSFELLYKVVGRGTNLLSKKKKADTIDVLGPLGNGFNLRSPAILVAGGMGVAPLVALAEQLADRKQILVFIGARTKQEVLCRQDFKRLGLKVHIATDDGSLGYKGLVTGLLKKILLRTTNYELRTTIYACGPKPMLKELSQIGRRSGMTTYGSLEENMACGVGACLGCAVSTTSGYKKVCSDGPVFNLQEINWEQ
ncbi:MAG: dihydroorotate dehydrogenase electron transfer subunit [Candidatus Omnitrophica bacterium]|nr:dihydroorotate dehydrogenase electron transfer subunit [Candidatus Omnitrophota bacterium]